MSEINKQCITDVLIDAYFEKQYKEFEFQQEWSKVQQLWWTSEKIGNNPNTTSRVHYSLHNHSVLCQIKKKIVLQLLGKK